MFCRKCGTSIEEGARFCGECGEPVTPTSHIINDNSKKTMTSEEKTVGKWSEAVQDTGNGSTEDFHNQSPVNGTYLLILKIFAGIMTAVFAIYTITDAFSGVLGTFSSVIGLIMIPTQSYYMNNIYVFSLATRLISSLTNLVAAVGELLMVLTMLSVLLGWSKEKAKQFPLTTIPAGILMIGSVLLNIIITLIIATFVFRIHYTFVGVIPFFLLAVIAIGGMFGLTMLLGFNPFDEISTVNDFIDLTKIAVFDTIRGFSELLQGVGKKNKGTEGSYQRITTVNGEQFVQREPVRHLNTDRGLAKYIVLSVVTCGIYGLIMLHGIAKDLNTAFEGDGEETPGIWMYILMTLLTCGIYAIFWMYWTGNRIAKSGRLMYDLHFEENGTTLLIWDLFAASTCGIGGFMMWHYLLKNTNIVCRAYNEKNRV